MGLVVWRKSSGPISVISCPCFVPRPAMNLTLAVDQQANPSRADPFKIEGVGDMKKLQNKENNESKQDTAGTLSS